jgi:hypothetical protein
LGREYFLQGDFANAQQDLHRCSSLQVMQNVPVSQRRFECWYLQGQAAQILGDCEALIATYNEFRSMAATRKFSKPGHIHQKVLRDVPRHLWMSEIGISSIVEFSVDLCKYTQIPQLSKSHSV